MRRALAVLAALAVTSCSSPAWDHHDYALKAGMTAESAASDVEFVRLAVQHEPDLTRPYLKTVLTEAAGSLSSLNDQFGAVQPPSASADAMRDQVLGLTQEAAEQVQDLLIQVRRDRIADPAGAAAALGEVGAELRAFGEAHR
ncbi:hypothetical protein [Nonomuraea soli]|uniref:DUF305 domain-containing protein n=1 Tax=Nonomuraea soli TaxID=1032476 RepID=A0A7W0CL46_9ACTN|nr:hypothetical protein [Nonomuraea soli]MBA2893130.1 hypothetical protein [Nonomuraea soli]